MPQFGGIKSKQGVSGKAKGSTWDKMRSRLQDSFLPEHYTQSLFQRFHFALKDRRERSVQESPYSLISEFYQLFIRNGLNESDAESLACLIGLEVINPR